MTRVLDLMGEDREELLSLLSRFLDPGCHSEQGFAALAREVVHSPSLGDLAREIFARAEAMGMTSPADALDAWREKTRGLLRAFCCAPGPEVVESLMGEPYRPGLDRPFTWFEECCDDCYAVFMRALEQQRYLCAGSAFDAWNEIQEGGPVAEALRLLETEESLRFTDTQAGLDACRKAYRLSKEALPQKPGRLDEPRTVACLSVHAVAAARVMNAYRYTSDIPRSREMMKVVEKLAPACAAFHLAEVNALLGVLKADIGEIDEALRRLGLSVDEISKKDQHLAGHWAIQLAEIERRAGKEEFIVTLQNGIGILDPRRDDNIYQISVINLASALAQEKRSFESLEILRKVDSDIILFAAAGKAIAATIYQTLGDFDAAWQEIQSAINEYSSLSRASDVAVCLLLKGEIQQKMGHATGALQSFLEAISIFDTLNYPRFKTAALQELAEAARAGDVNEAAGLAKKARERPKPLPLIKKDLSTNQQDQG